MCENLTSARLPVCCVRTNPPRVSPTVQRRNAKIEIFVIMKNLEKKKKRVFLLLASERGAP
jgi:hypothetical protein